MAVRPGSMTGLPLASPHTPCNHVVYSDVILPLVKKLLIIGDHSLRHSFIYLFLYIFFTYLFIYLLLLFSYLHIVREMTSFSNIVQSKVYLFFESPGASSPSLVISTTENVLHMVLFLLLYRQFLKSFICMTLPLLLYGSLH